MGYVVPNIVENHYWYPWSHTALHTYHYTHLSLSLHTYWEERGKASPAFSFYTCGNMEKTQCVENILIFKKKKIHDTTISFYVFLGISCDTPTQSRVQQWSTRKMTLNILICLIKFAWNRASASVPSFVASNIFSSLLHSI